LLGQLARLLRSCSPVSGIVDSARHD
jgi:hypothetical protein